MATRGGNGRLLGGGRLCVLTTAGRGDDGGETDKTECVWKAAVYSDVEDQSRKKAVPIVRRIRRGLLRGFSGQEC